MSKITTSYAPGIVSLVYWIVFYLVTFIDLYVTCVIASMVLKALFPVIIICNILGFIMAAGRLKQRRVHAAAGLILNGLPLVGIACFLYWLFFGIRI